MYLKNGVLASARIDEIKASLGTANFRALMISAGADEWHEGYDCVEEQRGDRCKKDPDYMCNPKICQANVAGVRFGTDSMVLQGVSQADRDKFLQSLDFVNGRLASAYVGGLQKRLKTQDFDRVCRALGAQPREVRSKATAGLYRAGVSKAQILEAEAPRGTGIR